MKEVPKWNKDGEPENAAAMACDAWEWLYLFKAIMAKLPRVPYQAIGNSVRLAACMKAIEDGVDKPNK